MTDLAAVLESTREGRTAPQVMAALFDQRMAGLVDWDAWAGEYQVSLLKSFGKAAAQGQAIRIDPNRWGVTASGYYERPGLSWSTLARMAGTSLIASIIGVRTRQIQEYCRPQVNTYLPGYQVRLRSRKKHPTRTETVMSEDLARWVQQCGVITDSRQAITRPGFAGLMTALMEDSLTYNQACAEVIPTVGTRLRRDGAPTPARLQVVDASTIRAAECPDDNGWADDDFTSPRWVQVIDGHVVREFEPSRLMVGIRSQSSSIYRFGYGVSELELVVQVLTAWLNVFNRNSAYFDKGFTSRGFFNFRQDKETPALTEAQMAAIRREIKLSATGNAGHHRVGVINSPGVEFISPGSEAQDAQWLGFSDQGVKLVCAIHGMDPAEINFTYGNTGQSSAMGGASIEEKVEASRARGLTPLVRASFDWIDRWVIQQIDPDFEIVPTGLGRDELDELDLDQKKVSSIYTLNEVRATKDLPPIKGGDVVLNPSYLQALGMSQGQDDGGGEDDGGAPEMDMSSLFGEGPREPQQPNPQSDAEAARANSPAPPGGAGQALVKQQPEERPLAASRGAGSMRRTTITL